VVLIGLALAVAWCMVVLPTLFVAEAGARLTLSERALLAAPMAVASAVMIIGGRNGRSAGTAKLVRNGRLFEGAIALGGIAGIAAFWAVLT
jgi:hypothetical protein